MPKQRQYLILEDFDFCPRSGVVMTFKAGETKHGLTRACLFKAGAKVQEIGGNSEPE